jgi:hypothetical protein
MATEHHYAEAIHGSNKSGNVFSHWMSRVSKKVPNTLPATSETTLQASSTNPIQITLPFDIKSWIFRKGNVRDRQNELSGLVRKPSVDTNFTKDLQLEYSSSMEENDPSHQETVQPKESLHNARTQSISSIRSYTNGRRAGIYIPSSVIHGRDPKSVAVDSMFAYQVYWIDSGGCISSLTR